MSLWALGGGRAAAWLYIKRYICKNCLLLRLTLVTLLRVYCNKHQKTATHCWTSLILHQQNRRIFISGDSRKYKQSWNSINKQTKSPTAPADLSLCITQLADWLKLLVFLNGNDWSMFSGTFISRWSGRAWDPQDTTHVQRGLKISLMLSKQCSHTGRKSLSA